MKRLLMLALAAVVAMQMGCAGARTNIKDIQGVSKVAVVSFALNDYGSGSAVKWGGDSASGGFGGSKKTQAETIQNATNELLSYTEKKFSERWKVTNASSFANSKPYTALTVEKKLNAYLPKFKGKELGLFTQNSTSLKKVQLKPETAKKLCATLKVDAVVLVYSEWTTKMGGIVPITKPLTKNLVSVWDKTGQQLFIRRVDRMGSKVIGGMGAKVSISLPAVIESYKDSYKQALDLILQ